jgi:hypothetical protein
MGGLPSIVVHRFRWNKDGTVGLHDLLPVGADLILRLPQRPIAKHDAEERDETEAHGGPAGEVESCVLDHSYSVFLCAASLGVVGITAGGTTPLAGTRPTCGTTITSPVPVARPSR